jgi:hypothetical protein
VKNRVAGDSFTRFMYCHFEILLGNWSSKQSFYLFYRNICKQWEYRNFQILEYNPFFYRLEDCGILWVLNKFLLTKGDQYAKYEWISLLNRIEPL